MNALKTDLYELTMAAGYFQNKVELKATFELFAYRMPSLRLYLVACGLQQAVDYILNLRFSQEDIDFLRKQPVFRNVKQDFFEYLKEFKFSGDLWAMPEGEIFFANEPIIQIEAPIIEAQILETCLLSVIHIQTLISSKASRVVQAARCDGINRGVVDFGSRRAHGPEAAILAARAAYIAGCIGTSNVYAAKRFNIPVYGTMAHSWIEAFDGEREAFLKYYEVFPDNMILLIDTYNTIKGAQMATTLKKQINSVRLDSGNLAVLSKKVRRILDKAGLNKVKIIASGNLNEYRIRSLVKKKSPIDFFGVGTEMVTSFDLPSLDLIYKLVQTQRRDGAVTFRAKFSPGKRTIPGKKQVFRRYTKEGFFLGDTIGLCYERPPRDSRPLLEPVIRNGRLIKPLPDIETIRINLQENLSRFPKKYLELTAPRPSATVFSKEIKNLSVS
jgi:nicotinate phosphoribosyltransferase